MARHHVILPQADTSCGKIFFSDRRTAEGHRIALEVWNRATGRVRAGYGLAVHRCRRCGGFHVSLRPLDRIVTRPVLAASDEAERAEPETWNDWDDAVPRVRHVSVSDSRRM